MSTQEVLDRAVLDHSSYLYNLCHTCQADKRGLKQRHHRHNFLRLVWSGGGFLSIYLLAVALVILMTMSGSVHAQGTTATNATNASNITNITDTGVTSPDIIVLECGPTVDCHPDPVDLVNTTIPGRSIDVSSTCGASGIATPYLKSSNQFDSVSVFYCNSSNVTEAHPKEHMLDRSPGYILDISYENPILLTYWQSINTIPFQNAVPYQQWVSFNFTTVFQILKVRLIFIAPHVLDKVDNADMRPRAIAFERRASPTSPYVGWRYYASSCSLYFPGVLRQEADGSGPDYNAITPVCIETYFAGDAFTFTGWGFGRQQVEFNPSREFGREFSSSYSVLRYYQASDIRARLVWPADNVPLSSYYAVADFMVEGQCACYGHAQSCQGEMESKCICLHNTMGDNCETCMPLFNNRPWQVGFDNKANECQDCGCNGHAESCHYDAFKGYGVCDGCILNTAGDKCQFCVRQYYVNPNRNPNITALGCTGFNGTHIISYNCGDWCIPCNCNTTGSMASSGYTCQNATGNCDCKAYVQGRACDECKDGFYGLSATNMFGCFACVCHIPGTLNNQNLCNKMSGECLCKANVQGSRCDYCQDKFFGLSQENEHGCVPCECDPGASLSTICPVDTGVCDCRANIDGRTCDTPITGFYVPMLDDIIFEAEFVENVTALFPNSMIERDCYTAYPDTTCTGRGSVELAETQTISFLVTVPKAMQYTFILRYETEAAWSEVLLDMTAINLQTITFTNFLCANGQSVQISSPIRLSGQVSSAPRGGSMAFAGTPCLKEGVQYRMTLSVGSSFPINGVMRVDSVVLLPVLNQLKGYSVEADNVTKQAMDTCYTLSLGTNYRTRANLSCANQDYSIMAEVYNGAQPCSCNPLGSNSTICDPFGGQCSCWPGVGLRDCSQCKVAHYGFADLTFRGCQACNCHSNGSRLLTCDAAGTCQCRPNVTGIKCDQCFPNQYGLQTLDGCKPCQCNSQYAFNSSCMDSGQCYCKPGIGGISCDQCLNGFYNLTTDGCTPCNCNPLGSRDTMCNNLTGLCDCQVQVTGDKCDQCNAGYYALGHWGDTGCIPCFCSGQSGNCSSASGFFQGNISDNWSLLYMGTALDQQWTAVDELGQSVPVERPTKFPGEVRAQFVQQVTMNNITQPLNSIYLVATPEFLGDKRSSYGMSFTFALGLIVPPPMDNTTAPPQFLVEQRGDVRMKGRYTDYAIVSQLPMMPTENATTYNFLLREAFWQINHTDGALVTYSQMMKVLADLEFIHIRAKYTNVSGAELALYNAKLGYATRDPTSMILATNVEQCVCPPGYTGQFCEQCSPGFTRTTPNGGIFAGCGQCNCNNHSAAPCNPETGNCTCTHNTTGNNCEICLDGFFGFSRNGQPDDCKPCMCPGNVVMGDENVFATTCIINAGSHICNNCSEGHSGDQCEICVPGYYGTPANASNNGGKCVPCSCNGRADTCNSTSGMCVNCRNNTAGKECDICGEGYFGNAFSYDCKPCDCTSLGALGTCDDRTGQCDCKPNVEGYSCDQCIPNTYNYTSGLGCSNCSCDPVGAIGKRCDLLSGQCTCRVHVTGRQCNMCEDKYWKVNSITGCDSCLCTTEGTKNDTANGITFGVCDLVTGQCPCSREAIIGRTCDHCAKGTLDTFVYVEGIYVGQYPTCDLCGECFDNWGHKIDQAGLDIRAQYNEAMVIWSHYDNTSAESVIPTLTYIRSNLTGVENSIGNATEMLSMIRSLEIGYEAVMNQTMGYTRVLDALALTMYNVGLNLSSLSTFNGGFQVMPGVFRSASQIETDANTTHESINTRYATANTSWANIQQMTEAIRISNGNVDVFSSRVNAAMQILQVAQGSRMTADGILNGPFESEFLNNTERLQELLRLASQYGPLNTRINELIRVTIVVVEEAVKKERDTQNALTTLSQDMDKLVAEAQSTRFNTTVAHNASNMAQSASTIYSNTARYVKGNLTNALVDVAKGLSTMQNVTRDFQECLKMTAEVNAMTLRPLNELVGITSVIDQSNVNSLDVQQAFNAAARAQAIADDAKNTTSTAADQSQIALAQIQNVQLNLQEALSVRTQTQMELDRASDFNKTAVRVINEVSRKAANALFLADQSDTSSFVLVGVIQTLELCFLDKQQRAVALLQRAQNASSKANDARLMYENNQRTLLAISQSTSNAKVQADALNNQLLRVQDSLNQLKATMQALDALAGTTGVQPTTPGNAFTEGLNFTATTTSAPISTIATPITTDLVLLTGTTGLLADVVTQKAEMDAIVNELLNLEGEANSLVASLALLDPETAVCTHS